MGTQGLKVYFYSLFSGLKRTFQVGIFLLVGSFFFLNLRAESSEPPLLRVYDIDHGYLPFDIYLNIQLDKIRATEDPAQRKQLEWLLLERLEVLITKLAAFENMSTEVSTDLFFLEHFPSPKPSGEATSGWWVFPAENPAEPATSQAPYPVQIDESTPPDWEAAKLLDNPLHVPFLISSVHPAVYRDTLDSLALALKQTKMTGPEALSSDFAVSLLALQVQISGYLDTGKFARPDLQERTGLLGTRIKTHFPGLKERARQLARATRQQAAAERKRLANERRVAKAAVRAAREERRRAFRRAFPFGMGRASSAICSLGICALRGGVFVFAGAAGGLAVFGISSSYGHPMPTLGALCGVALGLGGPAFGLHYLVSATPTLYDDFRRYGWDKVIESFFMGDSTWK